MLRIDLTDVDLFVGAGGVFDTTGSSIDVANATGLFVDDANLSLAIATVTDAAPADTRRWTGIAASANGMNAIGLPTDVTLTLDNLTAQYNTASGTGGSGTLAPIDWSTLYPDVTDPLHDLTGGPVLSVEGDLTVNLGGYVLAAGHVSINQTTDVDAGLDVNVDLLTIDLVDVNLFVGLGAVFDTTTPESYSIDVTDATGFFVDDADLSIAIANPTGAAPGDTRRWTGNAATADGMHLVGLPDITFNIDNLAVAYNTPDTTNNTSINS